MITIIAIWIVFISIRLVEVFILLKKVSRICHEYDWKHADKYGFPALEMLEKKDYYVTSKWSAYNFMFLNGPNPLLMFFSKKPLTIEGQYSKDNIERLRDYDLL